MGSFKITVVWSRQLIPI